MVPYRELIETRATRCALSVRVSVTGVAVWMCRMPMPRGREYLVEFVPRLPLQNVARALIVGEHLDRITGAPRSVLRREIDAADALCSLDHFDRRRAATGADVQRCRRAAALEIAERAQVRGGEIVDVDVVADRRTVRRRVVGAVDREHRNLAECRHHRHRYEVQGPRVVLPDATVGRSTRGVEVAERHETHAVTAVVPLEHL